ncbi:unnamed protein product [Arabidopsis lyrata]|nr:unnamed protein product [Arabidopsis lyrata]
MSIASKRYNIDSYVLLDLDNVLDDVYCSFRPVSADYDTRKELVKNLNAMAIDIFEESRPVLEAYGSFVMDTFSPQRDLDVSINFGSGTSELSRVKKLEILERFATKLRSLEGQVFVRNVVPIFNARVPIVKFCDQRTGIECDLAVESKDGILVSKIIRIISQIDDRFQKLCLLIKHWAKAHGVNSASQHTLNSIYNTARRSSFTDGIDPPNVEKRTQNFLNWGQCNQESLGKLFATFFIKLQSVEFLWRQGLCASVLNGLWISKKKKWDVISVEDFTDVSKIFARVVSDKGAEKIYSSINKTVDDIFEFLNGKFAGEHLTQKLFSQQAVVEPSPPVSPQQPHNKRVCLENGYKAVRGTGNGREEIYENPRGKRKTYAGRNGSCRFSGGEEPMPVGLWHDYSRSLDMPTPPPHYDRLLYKKFGLY